MNDNHWMQLAFEQALIAESEGEIPVGAVLVGQNQELLGVGRNSVQATHDPSAHAEFNAIRKASQQLNNHRLLNTTLYVTLEPCTMCAGLLVHSRIRRVVFGTRDFKAGAAGSIIQVLQGYPFNHRVIIDEGPMQAQCSNLLQRFFEKRRMSDL